VQANENITNLFSAVFPRHRKLICSRGSTHPHFNFTSILHWKITHIYIIIHNNHTQQSNTIISSIQHSPLLSLIHTLKSVIHIHPSLILSIYTSLIHRYRLGNFHYVLGGGGSFELVLPPEAKMALTKSEPGRGG
jgi:hypothetical protein